ncbi:MAG: tyrosine-type recombinase/integrase, partial [Gaiellaceae bacterium]
MARKRTRGGSVLRYKGARGAVWRIKYRDAENRQVMETLGREAEGWTERKAEAELRERLVRVERKAYRHPQPTSFTEYAKRWFDEGQVKRGWKPRTVRAYRTIVGRLTDHFGPKRLTAVRPGDVAGYVRRHAEALGAATLNRDLSILHAIYDAAIREELVDVNPAAKAERLKLPAFRPRILKPAEIQAVRHAFVELARAALVQERETLSAKDLLWHKGLCWRYEQARVVFLTLVLTGLRRFELQSLRWRDVDLVELVLRVVDSKSEDGVRSIALSPALAEELWQLRRRSPFMGEDELVFCHPDKGTAFSAEQWRPLLQEALNAAEIRGRIRPFHDLRHTAITLDAASGSSEIAVMTKAGHASFKTTQRYLHLAGVVFREEAERLEEKVLGPQSSTNQDAT